MLRIDLVRPRTAWDVAAALLAWSALCAAAALVTLWDDSTLAGMMVFGLPAGLILFALFPAARLGPAFVTLGACCALFGSVLVPLLVTDGWRAVHAQVSAVRVVSEDGSCGQKAGCPNRSGYSYAVRLEGVRGELVEREAGEFPVGSTVRVRLDSTGLVSAARLDDPPTEPWSTTITGLLVLPVGVAAAAVLRRRRRDGPRGADLPDDRVPFLRRERPSGSAPAAGSAESG